MIVLVALAGLALDGAQFFNTQVAPILKQNCIKCHNHELDDGDISFEDRATLVKDRPERGPAIVPGEPDKSALIRAIRHAGDYQMPPGKKLSQENIDTLVEWVKRGAPWGTNP